VIRPPVGVPARTGLAWGSRAEERMATEKQMEKTGAKAPGAIGSPGFWEKHRSNIFLALLFVYVVLLGIGTVAELFHIESILRWPIYR
jgi:hypothetical protein